MKKTTTIYNQKGGVGKSTTTQALAAGFTLRGYRTLTVDLDTQGNTSFSLGANSDGLTALEVFLGEAKASEAIQKTNYGDVIAGNRSLAGADAFLTGDGREYLLRNALEEVAADYDYIFIDTPATLGIITTNALTASDSVIIPAQPELYSLQSVSYLAEMIEPIREYCNPALEIEGILLTRSVSRSSFNREFIELTEELAANLDTKVFNTVIREAMAIRRAQLAGVSIFEYDKRAKVTSDYTAFIDELLGEGDRK